MIIAKIKLKHDRRTRVRMTCIIRTRRSMRMSTQEKRVRIRISE